MRFKNIAVLMTALDSEAQAIALKGIEEYGKDRGFNIAVFLWYTGAFEKDKHNLGEVNIVNLPDLSLFDGVIVFSNVFHIENNRRMIEEILEPLTCPIVCIGCKLKDYYSIRTDNYTAMRKLVEHFVVDHKAENIHFVKGIEGNEDASERYRAFEDVMKEHGIPIQPERISQGDFYVTGGEEAAEEILNCVLPFPDAIICANDVMAITICDILVEKGYRVPEDVIISGYDYSIESQGHYPRITSVRSRFMELGMEACKVVVDLLSGKNVEKDILLPDEVILDESCGCEDQSFLYAERDVRLVRGEDINRRKMLHQLIKLEKNLTEGNGLNDWMESLREFIPKIDVSEAYCCVNEGFVENVFELDILEQEEMTTEERLAYSRLSNPILSYKNGTFVSKASFESKYAFDDMFKESDKCKLYIFSPMHFLERNFGYFVFVDSAFPFNNQLYISWLIKIGDSVENIRKQSMLQNAMNRLDDMYIRDSLTGVYNRFGMERHFAEIKRKCMMSRISMQFSFIDLDNLKMINDVYGHETGDEIISAAAEILQKESGKFYVIRYGGDEFIVMGTVHNKREVEEYWLRVQQRIEEYNAGERKAKLSMSFGCEVFRIEAKTYLEDCIRVTDKKMYEEKKKKKQVRV